jgi:hypothetical protein
MHLTRLRDKKIMEGFMADRIIEEHIHTSDSGSGGAFGALAVLLVVLALIMILYFTGAFGRMFGTRKTDIDINIKKPEVVLPFQPVITLNR